MIHPSLCYSSTGETETRHSWQPRLDHLVYLCVCDRELNFLFCSFSCFLCPGSCFCPQDVVEEAVLLLLITESMVRRLSASVSEWTVRPTIVSPLCSVSLSSDQRRRSDQPPAGPGRGPPGQPAGCHLRVRPAQHRHGQEGAVCHAV